MTNEELETIKNKLQTARRAVETRNTIELVSVVHHELNEALAIIDNVQKRAVSFGKGPDCYNCNCKTRCERYA